MSRPLPLLAVLLLGCGGASPPDAALGVPDAGRDAGSSDAGLDLGGPDRGVDLGPEVPINPACTSDGCLRALTPAVAVTAAELRRLLAPTVTVDNGYALSSMRFVSGGREVLATLAVPDSSPPTEGFGTVLNAHGTTGVADICATTGTDWGFGLAGTFAARGLVGVAPDYPGLGTEGPHPYLVADVSGRALLDAARATSRALTALEVPSSGRVAIVGNSQGGHAALAAGDEQPSYAPELDLVAVGASGPAAVLRTQWAGGLDLADNDLVYHALLAYAWNTHYDLGLEPFRPALAVDEWMESRCAFPPRPEDPTLATVLPARAEDIFTPAFLAAWRDGGTPAWDARFRDNDLDPYRGRAPVRIYQGTADPVVLEAWSAALVRAMRFDGASVEYETVPGAGHVDVAFGFLAFPQARTEEALAWLRDRLTPP